MFSHYNILKEVFLKGATLASQISPYYHPYVQEENRINKWDKALTPVCIKT